MKPQRFGIRDLLEKYVDRHSIFERTAPLLEDSEFTPQDSEVGRKPLSTKQSAESKRSAAEITNVKDRGIPSVRNSSPFKYFLDGCRKTYHLCDFASNAGHIVPLIAGQFSSAIVKRDNETGKISLYKHDRRGIVIILSGGDGLNGEDAKELVRKIEERATATGQTFYAKDVHLKLANNKVEKPQDKAIAQIQMEMHGLEVRYLEEMAIQKEVDDEKMIIVDGPLQFRLPKHHNRAFLEYAIGVSKSFNLYLENIVEKHKQIGSHLLKLEKPGDRTSAFVLEDEASGIFYAYWYLRIQPRQRMNYPLAGIIRVEKALVNPEEQEDRQVSSDKIDYLSSYLLIERHVNPYGSDSRWASHLYPIYLSERIQKEKFLSDHYFYSLLK
jgi:hypothetical protein